MQWYLYNKGQNVSIAPKTSVQAQLYHADSRDKPCLTADNMTVCLRKGDQFAGSKNAFLNAVVKNYDLNSTASQCFPPWGNHKVHWIYIKIANTSLVSSRKWKNGHTGLLERFGLKSQLH